MNALFDQRREQMFPKLSGAQIARLAAHGQRLDTKAGEVILLGSRHSAGTLGLRETFSSRDAATG